MDEQRTIRIIGLEGKVYVEDLYKGIYLIMGKPECVRVQIVSPSSIWSLVGIPPIKDESGLTAYPSVRFWEDQPTAAFQDSFVDVAAGEVIIADAWVAKQTALEAYRKTVAPAWEAYLKAEAMALEAREKAFDQAWEAYDRVEALTLEAYQKDMAQKAYEEALAQARETYAEALAQAQKAYDEAKAPAREEYKKARAQAKKEEDPDV